ncbi:MAG: hypothetical protein HFE61_00560 [Anaerotignum sp.]|jgi:hypothetical protein|nr:hypothetical protein [Anaerotignum sp.]
MEYTMEELFPILGQLAEKYTAFESTSIPYETAEQLTEAVLYCIREAEQVQTNALVQAEGLSARQAYAIGAAAVEEKTRAALALYHETLQDFDSYGNRCLYDAFQQGLPEFFKWYDTKFMPQETMLTLDYPLLRDLSGQTGIDRIYSFIECIHLEQAFLNGFPEGTVKGILSRYNSQYGSLMENVCEIVLTTLAGHLLAGKPLSEREFVHEDFLRIRGKFANTCLPQITQQLKNAVAAFIQKYYGDSTELTAYLSGALENITFRLKNAAESGTLSSLL